MPAPPFANETTRSMFRTDVLKESPSVFLHDVLSVGNTLDMQNDGVDPTVWITEDITTWIDYYIVMTGSLDNTLKSSQPLGIAFTDAWAAINGPGFTMCWWMRSTNAGQTVIFHTKNVGDERRLTIRLTSGLEFNMIQLLSVDVDESTKAPDTYTDGRWQIFPATPQVNDGEWHFVSIGYVEPETFSLVVDNNVITDRLVRGNGLIDTTAFDAISKIGFSPAEVWGDAYNHYRGDIASFTLIPQFLGVDRMREIYRTSLVSPLLGGILVDRKMLTDSRLIR